MSKGTQPGPADGAGEHECALVYHVRRKRRLRGFLPLYVLLSALLLGGLLWLVPIRMPEDERPGRIGRVYYRDDRLLQFHLMQRSPLPFSLPDGVDPAAEPVGRLEVPLRRPAALMGLEPLPLYGASGDSCVLDEVDLLALPPEETALEAGSADTTDGALSPSQAESAGATDASFASDTPRPDVSDSAVPGDSSEPRDEPASAAPAAETDAAPAAADDEPASGAESGARSSGAPHPLNPSAEAAGDTEASARPGEEVQP